MAIIDSRLKDCDTDQDITENFNRVLNIVDSGSGGSTDVLIKVVELEETNDGMVIKCTPNQVSSWLQQSNNNLIMYIKTSLGDNSFKFFLVEEIDDGETRKALTVNNNTFYPINDDMDSYYSIS